MAYLINLVIIVTLDQFIMWFSWFVWSFRADLLISAKPAVFWWVLNMKHSSTKSICLLICDVVCAVACWFDNSDISQGKVVGDTFKVWWDLLTIYYKFTNESISEKVRKNQSVFVKVTSLACTFNKPCAQLTFVSKLCLTSVCRRLSMHVLTPNRNINN